MRTQVDRAQRNSYRAPKCARAGRPSSRPAFRYITDSIAVSTATVAIALSSGEPSAADVHNDAISSRKTTAIEASTAYSRPLSGLNATQLREFTIGKAEFAKRWVAPFLGTGEWGRGPQSSAGSCIECHPGNGRGRAPDGPDQEPHSLVLQLALANVDAFGRALPHHAYGRQLNKRGTLGKIVEEGSFRIDYQTSRVVLGDGEVVQLRTPTVRVTSLWFGPLGDDTALSPRVAQPVFGLGLLEAIPASTLHAIATAQHRIGINGRPNLVRDAKSGNMAIGRFGHKATEPNLVQQIASAFRNEMGVNSGLFPGEDCPPIQVECRQINTVNGPEVNNTQIAAIRAYLGLLAAPTRRAADDARVQRGANLFDRARCTACHVPSIEIVSPIESPNGQVQVIEPYTDLLLHDMGEGLSDGQQHFLAGPRDWRTPPLWGLGLRKTVNGNENLLHDGRARTVTEAILWHGGEAEVSRQSFITMTRTERQDLLRFLDSL